MRIEIDTRNDSKEEIIAAIKLLQATLGSKRISHSQSFTNAEELVDSNLRSSVEENNEYISKLQELSSTEKDKKEAYVGLFDSSKDKLSMNAESQKTDINTGVGLADFFSSTGSGSMPAQKTSQTAINGKKTELKPKERTSFFKEFDDDVDSKVKVVTY